MSGVFDIISQGWVGSVVGLLGLIIGIVGLVALVRSRIGAMPVYQYVSESLIGRKDQVFPKEVKILYREINVNNLNRTYIIMWNKGNKTINGEDIVKEDKIKVVFPIECEILNAYIEKQTRDVNGCAVEISNKNTNALEISFDFLDPNDGILIEVLHTGDPGSPKVGGTIKGVPKGFRNLGAYKPPMLFPSYFVGVRRTRKIYSLSKVMLWILGLTGLALVILGLFFDDLINETQMNSTKLSLRPVLLGIGSIYVIFSWTLLWFGRRRYPRILMPKQT